MELSDQPNLCLLVCLSVFAHSLSPIVASEALSFSFDADIFSDIMHLKLWSDFSKILDAMQAP